MDTQANEDRKETQKVEFGRWATRRRLLFGCGLVGLILLVSVFIVVRRDDSPDVPDFPGVKSAVEETEVLDVDDPQGSPRIVLPEAFDPAVNPDGDVPDDLEDDADEVLDVTEARMVQGGGPYNLVWKVERTDGDPIDCVNCAFVDVRIKKIIADVLRRSSSGDIDSIVGLDPTRTLAGDYSGNGWQVEFVVGRSAAAFTTGEDVAQHLLGTSDKNGVYSVIWQNLLYNNPNACDVDLDRVSPIEVFPLGVDAIDEAGGARDAGLDRVVVSSPDYSPQFENRDGAQFVTGWKATGC